MNENAEALDRSDTHGILVMQDKELCAISQIGRPKELLALYAIALGKFCKGMEITSYKEILRLCKKLAKHVWISMKDDNAGRPDADAKKHNPHDITTADVSPASLAAQTDDTSAGVTK
jgi:hypothetical protein